MAVLTPAQKVRLGVPPKPPSAQVEIVGKDGKPTAAWVNFLVQLNEWQAKLALILGE